MNKLFASAIFAASILSSNSVFAQVSVGSATGQLNLTATASANCTGLSFAPTGVDFSGAINTINNTQQAFGPVGVAGGTITCNFSGAKLGLKTQNGGLTLNGAQNTPSSPVPHIPYTATPAWAPLTIPVNPLVAVEAGGFETNDTVGANPNGALSISLSVAPNPSNVLPVGSYQDVLLINVGAGF